MVNAKGGFAYIDMSVYGAFGEEPVSFDSRVGDVDKKLRQKDKPIVLVGLRISNGEGEEDTVFPAMVANFLEASEDVFSSMTFMGNGALTVIFALDDGKITVSYHT